MERVEEKIADSRVIELVRQYLKQGTLEGCGNGSRKQGRPRVGISPLLANIYLDPLDHQMAEAGYEMIRYADDIVVLCRSEGSLCRLEEDSNVDAPSGIDPPSGKDPDCGRHPT